MTALTKHCIIPHRERVSWYTFSILFFAFRPLSKEDQLRTIVEYFKNELHFELYRSVVRSLGTWMDTGYAQSPQSILEQSLLLKKN